MLWWLFIRKHVISYTITIMLHVIYIAIGKHTSLGATYLSVKGFGSHEKPELETQPSTCRILDRLLPCPSKATFLAVSHGTRGSFTT